MAKVTLAEIDERLRLLSPEKLAVVYDFVSYLAECEFPNLTKPSDSNAKSTMLASEAVLRREWDRLDEDAAWAHL